MCATLLCLDLWRPGALTIALISHGMIARRFWRSYPAREDAWYLIGCSNSRRHAHVLTLILFGFVCGTCTPSTTIWLYLSHSGPKLLLSALHSCICHKWPTKKPTRSGAIGKSAGPTSFCIPARPAGKNFGRRDGGQN